MFVINLMMRGIPNVETLLVNNFLDNGLSPNILLPILVNVITNEISCLTKGLLWRILHPRTKVILSRLFILCINFISNVCYKFYVFFFFCCITKRNLKNVVLIHVCYNKITGASLPGFFILLLFFLRESLACKNGNSAVPARQILMIFQLNLLPLFMLGSSRNGWVWYMCICASRSCWIKHLPVAVSPSTCRVY